MQKDPETCAIIGAAMEVHRELGRGFLELVYQTALLNFGAASLEHKRLVFSPSDNLRKSAKSVDEIYL